MQAKLLDPNDDNLSPVIELDFRKSLAAASSSAFDESFSRLHLPHLSLTRCRERDGGGRMLGHMFHVVLRVCCRLLLDLRPCSTRLLMALA